MNSLVVFYSRTGLTRKAAEMLAGVLKADIEEIVDHKNRMGFWGYLGSGKDAFLKKTTKINAARKDPGVYDLVVIGTPLWALSVTPAVRTYLSQNKDRIRRAAFFCTKGGSPAKMAFADLAKLCGQKPVGTLELREDELKTGESFRKIEKFAQTIK
jgi:flavodoxin